MAGTPGMAQCLMRAMKGNIPDAVNCVVSSAFGALSLKENSGSSLESGSARTPQIEPSASTSPPGPGSRFASYAPSLASSTMTSQSGSTTSHRTRVLLSSGGRFTYCNVSNRWEYCGGETRLIGVRRTCCKRELCAQLSKSASLLEDEVAVRYELPGGDQILVDLVDDNDVENMWEEFDDYSSSRDRSAKLRLFIQMSSDSDKHSGSGADSGGPSLPTASTAAPNTPVAQPGTPKARAASSDELPSTSDRLGTTTEDGFSKASSAVERRMESGISSDSSLASVPRVSLADLGTRMEIIHPQHLSIVRLLGVGGFGEVYQCKWHGSDVAVKCLSPALLSVDGSYGSVSAEAVTELLKEAQVLGNLRHPNIMFFYGIVLPEDVKLPPGIGVDDAVSRSIEANRTITGPGTIRPPALVMEYLAGGSLRQALSRKADFLQSEAVKVKLALDTARGMEYLHSKRIVHFDLKSGNLLVGFRDKAPVAKVADFGLSKRRYQTYVSGVTSMRGTLPWTAPEIIKTPNSVTEKADVYSFGIVMWELWTGCEPFDGINYHALLQQMSTSNDVRPALPGSSEWEGPELREPVSGWSSLMQRCWAERPEDRPSFTEVVQDLEALNVTLRAARKRVTVS